MAICLYCERRVTIDDLTVTMADMHTVLTQELDGQFVQGLTGQDALNEVIQGMANEVCAACYVSQGQDAVRRAVRSVISNLDTVKEMATAFSWSQIVGPK
jgi:Mor family transcriptional regulator